MNRKISFALALGLITVAFVGTVISLTSAAGNDPQVPLPEIEQLTSLSYVQGIYDLETIETVLTVEPEIPDQSDYVEWLNWYINHNFGGEGAPEGE